ncbi:MAG: sarcosine oxidase [Geminicoccaceae bacterium]
MAASDGLTRAPLPTDVKRRSAHYRKLRQEAAVFGEVAGCVLPMRYRDAGDERAAARNLGLVELSPLQRIGFKGRAVLSRMNTDGVTLEFRPNRAFRQKDGTLAAVLAMTEVLLLSPLNGEAAGLDKLAAGWSIETADGSYLVPRRDTHYWFLVTGEQASSMFAKICGVDLGPKNFDNLTVAQTSIAKSTAIVIRDDRDEMPAYHLLGDSASAGYMWDCLMDAMAEFDGRPIGLAALLPLC